MGSHTFSMIYFLVSFQNQPVNSLPSRMFTCSLACLSRNKRCLGMGQSEFEQEVCKRKEKKITIGIATRFNRRTGASGRVKKVVLF